MLHFDRLCHHEDELDKVAAQHGRGLPGLRVVKVLLPRRALQLQSGSVRYNYRHGIANADFCQARRVSITFRQNKFDKYGV